MYKIFDINQKNEWKEYLDKIPDKDIYFSSEYFESYEIAYDEKAFLFCFQKSDDFIIFPFLKRTINNSKYFDIITPEYFTGTLHKINNYDQKKFYNLFFKEFENYCKDNNIISGFIRLHPFIKNYEYFQEVIKGNKFLYIELFNLSETEEEIKQNLEKSNRNSINKAIREGVIISIKNDDETIKEFHKIYTANMGGKDTNKRYFHPIEFFKALRDCLKENFSLYIAEYNNKIIGGAIFIHGYNFFHYFRASALKEYSKYCPSNLILYQAILNAKKNNYKIFVLGGGNRENDSLYKFKSKFSELAANSYCKKFIYDKKNYEKLTKIKKQKNEIKQCFFPAYRS